MRISDWSSDVCSSDLGHHQPGHACGFLEHLDLAERILPGGRVEHEHHIVRRRRIEPPEYATDLGKFVHQLALVLEPPGGVDDQHVDALGGAALRSDARRVGKEGGSTCEAGGWRSTSKK